MTTANIAPPMLARQRVDASSLLKGPPGAISFHPHALPPTMPGTIPGARPCLPSHLSAGNSWSPSQSSTLAMFSARPPPRGQRNSVFAADSLPQRTQPQM